MNTLAKNLRKRAEELSLSHAELARRINLGERRYAHYVSGRNEPDLATLVKIATSLGTTPNWLLGFSADGKKESQKSDLLDRLLMAGRVLPERELGLLVIQAEALAASVTKKSR